MGSKDRNALKEQLAGQPELLHSCVPISPLSPSFHPVLLLSSMREICESSSEGSPVAAEQTPELHACYGVLQATERDLMLKPVKHVQQILGRACRLRGASCRTEQAHCTYRMHASNGSRLLWVMSYGQRAAVHGCLPVQLPSAWRCWLCTGLAAQRHTHRQLWAAAAFAPDGCACKVQHQVMSTLHQHAHEISGSR